MNNYPFNSSDEVKKYLLEQHSLRPAVLRHHKVALDIYHYAYDLIVEAQAVYDPDEVFEDLKEYGYSQYLAIKATAYYFQGNSQKARKLATEAVLEDSFYAPAHNLLNRLDGKDDDSIQRQYICGLPFTEMQLKAVNTKDTLSFCCLQWSPYLMSPITDKNHEEVWNGDGAKEFRRSIIEGDYKYCNKRICSIFNNPEHNMIPRGQQSLSEQNSSAKEGRIASRLRKGSQLLEKQLNSHDPFHVDRPRHIFIAYDEGCNLACPSCRKQIKQVSQEQDARMSDLFEAVVRPLLKEGPTLLTASGHGDPLGSKHLREKLPSLGSDEYSEIKINLQTNGLLLNENGWKTLGPVAHKLEDIRISIDAGTKDTYEILRFPGKWEDLMHSLNVTAEMKQKLHFRLVLNFCIQECNFRELPEFLDLGKRLRVDRLNLQQLVNWGTYSADDYKKRNVVEKTHPSHQEFVEMLMECVSTCDMIQLSSSLPRLIQRKG